MLGNLTGSHVAVLVGVIVLAVALVVLAAWLIAVIVRRSGRR